MICQLNSIGHHYLTDCGKIKVSELIKGSLGPHIVGQGCMVFFVEVPYETVFPLSLDTGFPPASLLVPSSAFKARGRTGSFGSVHVIL
jgi:hypothetical protein